ncbi:monovalent cation/H(+) antiporter subunit G [Novosphingobium album (ex Liu et al. 2023)]|uniref:Monovalent cation/H(+) antiporter subunit G n=1 Tax=Novosphingobium album (ex Liu et al. 2023) TaxID=3031130 RepID=A0ABT5WWF2_9SPHN|nr:monovalent cation/H(+) antiporter subunit G [Novosphingobium album (ex Liu et al. 2023)]MDE8654240.1 monovalent cation/H(+) antiporter subunit G [Novosphingobium album (ex Liu et al. 2023)]
MIQAPDLPLWAALIVGLFVLLGAAITLVGAVGLIRMESFYERVHPPTLGMTLGTGFILIASIICFSVMQSRPVMHEVLIAVFVTITTPITLMLLARAALYRDRSEGAQDVPRDLGDAENGGPED